MSRSRRAARRRRARASRRTTIPTRSTSSSASAAGATGCRSFRRRRSASSACSPTATAPWNEPVAKIAAALRRGDAAAARGERGDGGLPARVLPAGLLALEAMCEEPYNLYGTQATTHPCTPLLIFNGPVAKEVGINAGHNAFGQRLPRQRDASAARSGSRSSTSAAAIPGSGDMSTLGAPAKFTFCVAENEAGEPVGAAARRARLPARGEHRDGDRRRRPAQRQRPREHHRRRHPHHDRRHDGDHRLTTTSIYAGQPWSRSAPSTRRPSPAAAFARPT